MLVLFLLTRCGSPKPADNEAFRNAVGRAEEMREERRFEDALAVYDSLYNEAVVSGDKWQQGFCLQQKGFVFQVAGRYKECLASYEKSYQLSAEIGDTSIMATSLLNRGVLYKHLGANEKAIKSLTEAASYFSSFLRSDPNDSYYMGDLASAYNSIGDIHATNGQTGKAFGYLFDALNLWRNANDTPGMSASYNFLGSLHMQLNQLDSALYYFTQSYLLKAELGDKKLMATTLCNIGDLKAKQGKFTEARKDYKLAYRYQANLPDFDGLAHTTYRLAHNYTMVGRYDSATLFLNHSTKLADSLNLIQTLMDDYFLWGELYQNLGDYRSGLLSVNRFVQLQDSVQAADKTRAFANASVSYELDQMDVEMKEAVAASNRNKTVSMVLSVFSLLLILLIYAVYRAYQIRKRGESNIKFLMRELNHRVKNNLQVLSSLLGLQTEQLKDTPAYEALRESENRVRAMALIHRKLYLTEQMTRVNMTEFINQLVNGLIDAYGYESNQIQLEIKIEQELLVVDKALPVGLIINELVSNSFKHAFKDVEKPVLRVSLLSAPHNHIILIVADNGPGMPDKPHNKSSFGLKLVKAQSRQLKAQLHMRNDGGALFELNIP